MTCSEFISLILSLLALILSLITFWYVSLRKGKIVIENPISFKSIGSPEKAERIPIQFPLVLTNTGSKSKILSKLYLIESHTNIVFSYSAQLNKLSIFDIDERITPQPIILPPFSSILVNIEFMSSEINFSFTEDPISFIIKSKINNSKKEKVIGNIKLKVSSNLLKKINSEMRMVENLAK